MAGKEKRKSLTPQKLKNKTLELKQCVHWRRMREAISLLEKKEKVNLKDYDLFNITCFNISGLELQGKNTFFNNKSNLSCFVFDNFYEFFEIPKRSNLYKASGEFLFLAHNISFDYWIFGKMSHSLDFKKTKIQNNFSEKVRYTVFGHYNLLLNEKTTISVNKIVFGKNVIYGGKNSNKNNFDFLGNRKGAYGTTNSKLLNEVLAHKNFLFVEKTKIEIFEKKKKEERKNKKEKLFFPTPLSFRAKNKSKK